MAYSHGFGYRVSFCFRHANVDIFDGRAKEHVGWLTFVGCIVPEKMIGQIRITQKPVRIG
jgi:hypothetical protein